MLDHSVNTSNESPTNSTSTTVVSSPDSFVPHDLLHVPVSSTSNTPFPFTPDQPLGPLSLNSVHNIIETYGTIPIGYWGDAWHYIDRQIFEGTMTSGNMPWDGICP